MSDVFEFKPREHSYLVAYRAKSMESRSEIVWWLKDRGAVHVLADVWFLRGQYRFAGDIQHEIERFCPFDGELIALGLNEATDHKKVCRKKPRLG
jgi:hypothetical protein